MNRKEIEDAIAGISAAMKGPLPNFERASLHADRKDLRAQLAIVALLDAPIADEVQGIRAKEL